MRAGRYMNGTQQDAIGGALSLGLGLCLLFWLIPHWVEPDPDLRLPVSLVPQVVAVGFVLCGAGLIGRYFLTRNHATASASDGFAQGELRGLIFMIVLLVAATFGFAQWHFLIVAPVIVAVSMWLFGPLRPISLVLTSVLGPSLIWLIGTQVLGRVLP